MRHTLTLLVALAFGLATFGRAADQRPNIVLIMTDDQGYGDLGITGNPVLETPHIDALARGGATLKNFYVSPVCSPTRASLLTGRYSYRTRVVDTFKGRSMMEPDEVTLAEVLRAAGYATGIFGKWHLGDNYPMRATDQGFEEALTLRGGGLGQPSDPIENNRRYTDPILFHNNRQTQAKGYCTDVFFDAALGFIDAAQRNGRPFFTYITPNAPHSPFHDVPPELYEKYKAKDLSAVLMKPGNDADTVARIYAMEENIDQNVGRLMAHLKERRLLAHTLVIFMSDNGPDGFRFVGPMRGRKQEVLDGGIRSPFFLHWPARVAAGATNDRIAAHIDVMPTLLAAAAVPVPAGLKLDGRNLLPLLFGGERDWPDRALVLQSHRGDRPVPTHNMTVRTQRWKLVHPTGFGRETPPPDVPFELYDVLADPLERTNLAAREPGILQQLRDTYAAWFADVSATRPDNFAPPRIVIGSDRATTTFLSPQEWRVPATGDNGREGEWLLRAERAAAYSVELRWPKPVSPGTLELKAGPVWHPVELTAATDRVVIERLTLPAGDLDLSVTHRQGDTRTGAYHVTLTRL
ncbi:MAG: arylsulfatase [Opitutaceae bacterium]|nr:arylsulfatase [Opitutaceae bacterium]